MSLSFAVWQTSGSFQPLLWFAAASAAYAATVLMMPQDFLESAFFAVMWCGALCTLGHSMSRALELSARLSAPPPFGEGTFELVELLAAAGVLSWALTRVERLARQREWSRD